MFNVFASKPDLIDHSASPFNAEPPLDRLRASMTTRQADFYVRSHGDIPGLEETKHQLRVGRPALPDDTWNFKSHLSAAWHRVLVTAS